uniref:alpha-methylacyl-CoA racemase-like isoform X1 n=1 Tax=Myxine glutinosa TaxID=7769 RepID=UPI00358ED04E
MQRAMVLSRVRVLELAGLAPGPLCGMILADFGAHVVTIDRVQGSTGFLNRNGWLSRGKRSVAVDLKRPEGAGVLRKLCKDYDVIIEPYRPGVMERLGLGPDDLMKVNPRLIYARLTGFGQNGPYAQAAGHDINYVALSGLLSMMCKKDDNPSPPLNLLADFAGGSALCALGIALALLERSQSGSGQVIDASMVEGAAYIGSFIWQSQSTGIWSQPAGENLLDMGAPFYNTYRTADNRFIAVGAIEPQFYTKLLEGLELNPDQLPPQMSISDWPLMKKIFAEKVACHTMAQWCEVFEGKDACVTPVLHLNESPLDPHAKARSSFTIKGDPSPAPKLSRTPAMAAHSVSLKPGEHTEVVLSECGFSHKEIAELLDVGAIQCAPAPAHL